MAGFDLKERVGADCEVLGLLVGVAVSTFSRTLALLFGLLVFGVQVWILPLPWRVWWYGR